MRGSFVEGVDVWVVDVLVERAVRGGRNVVAVVVRAAVIVVVLVVAGVAVCVVVGHD